MHTIDSIARELNRTPRSVQIVCRALFGPPVERPRVLSDAECERVLNVFQNQGRHRTTRQQAEKAKINLFRFDVTDVQRISDT